MEGEAENNKLSLYFIAEEKKKVNLSAWVLNDSVLTFLLSTI